MGNKCCGKSKESDTLSGEEMQGSAASEVELEGGGVGGSSNNVQDGIPSKPSLQHISDREDLTSHEGTLFSARKERRRSSVAVTPVKYSVSGLGSGSAPNSLPPVASAPAVNALPLLKRYSSCGTIYLGDSTVSQPNLKVTLQCVAIATHLHIPVEDEADPHRPPRLLDIFDEKLHPLTSESVPSDYGQIVPEQKHVYKFLKVLFSAAKLTAECAIITLIYLERLLHYAEIDLHPSNWKWIVLGSVLLASKVSLDVIHSGKRHLIWILWCCCFLLFFLLFCD